MLNCRYVLELCSKCQSQKYYIADLLGKVPSYSSPSQHINVQWIVLWSTLTFIAETRPSLESVDQGVGGVSPDRLQSH